MFHRVLFHLVLFLFIVVFFLLGRVSLPLSLSLSLIFRMFGWSVGSAKTPAYMRQSYLQSHMKCAISLFTSFRLCLHWKTYTMHTAFRKSLLSFERFIIKGVWGQQEMLNIERDGGPKKRIFFRFTNILTRCKHFVMTLQSHKNFWNSNSTKHKSRGIISLIDKTLKDDGTEVMHISSRRWLGKWRQSANKGVSVRKCEK